jgi:hypothetical protein
LQEEKTMAATSAKVANEESFIKWLNLNLNAN